MSCHHHHPKVVELDGPQGYPGPMGPRGDKGTPGIKGDTGPPGSGGIVPFIQTYTEPYTLTVPSSVQSVKIQVWGGNGGGPESSGVVGVPGGYSEGIFPVIAGSTLHIFPGKRAIGPTGGSGGFMNDEKGGDSLGEGFGGGGGSDVRLNGTDPERRIIVAGGGGGYHETLAGGLGGGLSGEDGRVLLDPGDVKGYGGTQTTPGAGFQPGIEGVGGNASFKGGAGGGGFYGGGAGHAAIDTGDGAGMASGGGGSGRMTGTGFTVRADDPSYVIPPILDGNGIIIVSWS